MLPVGNSTFVFIDTEGKMLGKLEIEQPATAQIPTPAATKTTTFSIYTDNYNTEPNSNSKSTCVRSTFGDCGFGGSAIN